jgi:hypothetical protein
MTRTASHNSALSLGSCISAAVTVVSIRTVARLSSLSCWALTNTARLTASQVSGRIALIVWCSTDFYGDQASGKRAKARNDAESSR